MLNIQDNECSLVDIVDKIESFEVYNSGEKELIFKQDVSFVKIKNSINNLFSNSRLMPAFGVSLHNETLKELKSGNWLQINFSELLTKNGLPFNSLLIRLEEVQGLNLIRLYQNRFDGRCLYLDLDSNFDLEDIIN